MLGTETIKTTRYQPNASVPWYFFPSIYPRFP